MADFVIGAALDGADEHVIGLSPGAVLNLYVIAVRSEVKVVDSGLGVCALTELDVVVAGAGDPHVKEADGVVVVGEPAVTSDRIFAVLSGVQEGVPLLVLKLHVDADIGKSTLEILSDSLVAVVGVVEVGEGREVGELLGSLIILVILLESIYSGLEVAVESVSGNIVVAVEAVVVACVLIEFGAVGIGDTHSNEGGSGKLAALSNVVDDVVAVEEKSDSVADLFLSLLSLGAGEGAVSGKDILVDVPADIVSTDLADDLELIGIVLLEVGYLVGGNVVDELPVAVLEVGELVVGVIGEIELDLGHGDAGGVYEMLILLNGDAAVVLPRSDGVGAVADIGGGVGRPGFVGDDILSYGVVAGECKQLVPISNRVVEGYFKGLGVESLDSELSVGVDELGDGVAVLVELIGILGLPNLGVALNDLEHIAVVGCKSGGSGAVPCEFKVVCGDVLTVGPLQTVSESVGIGDGAVIVDFALGQLGRCVGNDLEVTLGILSPLSKALEKVSDHRCAVN